MFEKKEIIIKSICDYADTIMSMTIDAARHNIQFDDSLKERIQKLAYYDEAAEHIIERLRAINNE